MRFPAVLVLLVVAAIGVGSASAATPLLVHGFASIGSFKVQGGTTASATRALGAPTSTHETTSSCTMRWPGLKLGFYTLADKSQCGAGAFDDATITGRWVTDRGLHRGDTVARAKQLYPGARSNSTFSGGLGLVVKTSPAIGDYGLGVLVRNGRVTDLVILDPQGGE